MMFRIVLLILALGALAAGVAGGLALAWGPYASGPGRYTPAALRPSAKEAYIEMVASAYALEQDARRARERIDLLDEVNIRLRVSERARQAAEAGDGRRAHRLADLGVAIGVEDVEIFELARPALLESEQWRWVGQNLLRCDETAPGESAPFLRLFVEDESGDALAGATAQFNLFDGGGSTTLVTGSDGSAQAPFYGEGQLTLSDGLQIPLYAPNFQATCTTDEPGAPHGLEIVVRAN